MWRGTAVDPAWHITGSMLTACHQPRPPAPSPPDNGLLTTKVQSREAQEGVTATLDGLRSGDAGERIPRESVSAAALYTNDFLP